MKITIAMLLVLAAASLSCAAASGYDPKRYTSQAKEETVDPDTKPLPEEPKTTIPDPKNPAPVAPTAHAAPTQTSAPEPSASSSATAAKPKAVAAASAATPAAKPTAAAPAAPPAENECGSKENPCPMQKLMRGPMTTAQTPEALEAAFNRVAGLSPVGGWAWASIAKKGAELAKAGDVAGAKTQCKACHDQHKEAYKKQFRAKKI